MTWMIPDWKLDSDQRQINELATKTSRSMFIQGPAGSGKSVSLVNVLNYSLALKPGLKVCMVLFTHSLIDMMRTGISTELLGKVVIFTAYDFFRQSGQWDLIIIDEVQDIEEKILDRVFKTGKKVLMAGDFSQSIYENGCSPEYIDGIQNLSLPKLKIIHRLTTNVQRVAAFFADDAATFMSYKVNKRVANITVQLIHHSDSSEEFESIWKKALEYARNGLATAILFPGNDTITQFCNRALMYEGMAKWDIVYKYFRNRTRKYDYDKLNNHLKHQQLPLQVIGGGAGSMRESEANGLVSVLTYHSAKGLDFEAVFLPGLTRDLIIWKDPDIERRMFFVALTRSRRDLFLSYYGEPHKLVKRIPHHAIQFRDVTQTVTTESGNDWKDAIDF